VNPEDPTGLPPRCRAQEIHTDVVIARAAHRAAAERRIRVFTEVRRVEVCEAELVSARAEADRAGWEVTALFRLAVGVETEDGPRVLKTLVFYRGRIHPRPEGHDQPHGSKVVVDIGQLTCAATVCEDRRQVEARLHFEVSVYALRQQVITVCRLAERGEQP
jgi:hypothetical protein